MFRYLFILLVLLVGCGDGVMVYTHHIPRAQFEQMFPGYMGYAYWNDDNTECDVYLMPRHEYESLGEYHKWKGHEQDHCERGPYHKKGQGFE